MAVIKFSVAPDKNANDVVDILLIEPENVKVAADKVLAIVVVVPEYDRSFVLVFKFEIAVIKFSVAPDKNANDVVDILLIEPENVKVAADKVLAIVVVVPEYDRSFVLVFKVETDEFKFVIDVFRSLPTPDKY
jgi:hypothetical protein